MTNASSTPQAASDATASTGAGQPMSAASAAAAPLTANAAAGTAAPANGKAPWETLPVTVKVNGVSHGPMDVPAGLMMIDWLHETLGLTGSRLGCGQGICHACVVIVDHADGSSETVRTCITGTNYFDGKTVRTVEGHAVRDADGKLTLAPIQQAFLDHFSFQCGYCTPGFVNAATVLIERLKRHPVARADLEAAITEGLNDHICRCTGYVRYYTAVRDVVLKTPGCIRDAK
ncbi:(2Fe-2S)-binding protein [Pandoraea sp. XJJ-1]|uniref:4-hydroxybenzoyl-CoA reductase subunit gamma n=1 Tax=Pandoraea cepalis TaxID=2508294 RepID=A0A5E4YVL3_9BURK|nr:MULTISPECIES: (2Fe-2S)-binding protein [Pandoraea]WAL81772.1 (2Fe-2S)-binding protein [Pandoraea sp. XJJ-1]VVE52427.1 4-hydroxybenzoyl-CoA reductase subunit gamma [Pandoraea cepalis]